MYLGLIIYSNRTLFFSRFDETYWKDKYEHSQWKLPLSRRTLGDDGLYLYEGYRLIRGDDPTTLNAEVPPLAKYLIGLSIITSGNGYAYGFIVTTLAIIAFFLLVLLLTQKTIFSLVTTLVVALDPLIAKQFTLTMLDSLQLLFLLFGLLAVAAVTRIKTRVGSLVWTIFAGLSLGFFAEVKFPVFAPVIAIILAITIWLAKKNKLLVWAFFVAAIAAYLIPYIPYFLLGHTFRQWLGVQKWIIMFFAHSGLTPTIGSVVTTLLANRNQNLFTRTFEPVPEWSPSWPLVTILGVVGLIGAYRHKKNRLLFFPATGILLSLLVFNAFIPFWTRYLISILPLLYFGTALVLTKVATKTRALVLCMIVLANMIATTSIVFPTPQETVSQFLSDWEHGFFQDMYEVGISETKQTMDRGAFHLFGSLVLYNAQIEDTYITVEPYEWRTFSSPQYVPILITYKTRNLGMFDQRERIPLVLENGQWRVSWDWEYVFKNLTTTSVVQTTVDPARRGGIFAKNDIPLAEDKESLLVWLTPSLVTKETEDQLFTSLEALFEKRIKAVHFHERYVRLGELDRPIPLGVIMRPLDSRSKAILTRFPAITTTAAFGRFTMPNNTYDVGSVANTSFSECCSLLYSTSSYDGTSGLEQEYNSTLKGENGGTLVLKDTNGHVVQRLIDKTKRDGENVRVSY